MQTITVRRLPATSTLPDRYVARTLSGNQIIRSVPIDYTTDESAARAVAMDLARERGLYGGDSVWICGLLEDSQCYVFTRVFRTYLYDLLSGAIT